MATVTPMTDVNVKVVEARLAIAEAVLECVAEVKGREAPYFSPISSNEVPGQCFNDWLAAHDMSTRLQFLAIAANVIETVRSK